jgi:hypothetical protein
MTFDNKLEHLTLASLSSIDPQTLEKAGKACQGQTL